MARTAYKKMSQDLNTSNRWLNETLFSVVKHIENSDEGVFLMLNADVRDWYDTVKLEHLQKREKLKEEALAILTPEQREALGF